VLGHAIGARHEVENGVAKAIVLPAVLRFNADAAQSGLRKVATSLGLPGPDDKPPVAAVVNAIEAVFRGLGIPRRLQDVHVPREALPDIAASAMGDWFLRGNPRTVRDPSEILQVLQEAW
jgi:alcohol dehydrogenase class IV